ncbi:MAG: hypothetical protein OXB88_10150 [Bacteriovoracales bacterium]|nr:hypothetical protein [Bacteriovoracales bacterium]
MKYQFYDIFKGSRRKDGPIIKLRSVGHCVFDKKTGRTALELNGFPRDQFYLEPEKDPSSPYDFLICHYRDKNPNLREVVGVGHLLVGINSGYIQLEFDLYENKNLYIILGHIEEMKMAA